MESTKFLKVIRLRESSLRNSRTRKPRRIGITARPTRASPDTANKGRSITDSLLKASANAKTKEHGNAETRRKDRRYYGRKQRNWPSHRQTLRGRGRLCLYYRSPAS